MRSKLTRRDLWTVPSLILLLGVLAVMTLDAGHNWGDDYAAYLNEAFAISEGRLAKQDELNLFMHPSPLTFLDEDADSLSYVWGYPLLLSVLHRLIGFDTWSYGSLIYYKLPSTAALALLGGLLFLFYRRRFSYLTSLFLSLLFCLSSRLMPEVNNISPDLPFLLCFMAALWLIELVLDEQRFTLRICKLCLLGVILWAAYVLRLNGVTALLTVALAHVIGLACRRKWDARLVFDAIPYLLCMLLLFVSYRFLPVPTSNFSDVGDVSLTLFIENAGYYFQLLSDWLVSLFSRQESGILHYDGIGPILLVLMLGGIWKRGLRENFHFTLLILLTLLTVCGLNYQQGLRYLYTVLPLILLFAAYGVQLAVNWLLPHFDAFLGRVTCIALRVASVLIMAVILLQNIQYAYSCFRTRGDALPEHNAYSTYAVDVYRYIQSETLEDSVFAFYKPRGLYLNTGRASFKPQIAPELVHNEDALLPYQPRYIPLETADYLLLYADINDEELKRIQIELDGRIELSLIYENRLFELYQLIK